MASDTTDSLFTSLGKGVYINRGKDEGMSQSELMAMDVPPPELILIFGWMGAKLSHLLKYTKVYEAMYPSATKILIQSSPSFFWSSERTKKSNLAPVVEALKAMGCIPSTGDAKSTRILVHTFSNGGCLQLITLKQILASKSLPFTSPNTTSALVLDSCPGNATLEASKRAFAPSFPNPILREIFNVALILLFFVASLRGHAPNGVLNWTTEMRKTLNSDNLLPWLSVRTPRLYLYAEKDQMVLATDVESHAAEARAAGFDVETIKFEDSAHVAHARTHPETYWRAIGELWKKAHSA